MRCLCVAGSHQATVLYANQDRAFCYDDPIREFAESQGGVVIAAAQCLFTGQRIIGLAFPNEQQRDTASRDIASLSADIAFADEGQQADAGCQGCPFFRFCVDEARRAYRRN